MDRAKGSTGADYGQPNFAGQVFYPRSVAFGMLQPPMRLISGRRWLETCKLVLSRFADARDSYEEGTRLDYQSGLQSAACDPRNAPVQIRQKEAWANYFYFLTPRRKSNASAQ